MGSQLLSILRQGVWASLTGGWYYDQKQSHFSNLFHLYIWLLLLCLPLVIELYIKSYVNHLLIWSLYSSIIASLFTVIKLLNAYFHHVFDSGEYSVENESIEEELGAKITAGTANKDGDEQGPKTTVHCFQDEKENWLTYVFDDTSFGHAHSIVHSEGKQCSLDVDTVASINQWNSPSSSSSESVVMIEGPTNVIHAPHQVPEKGTDSFSPLEGTSRGSPCLHRPTRTFSPRSSASRFEAMSSTMAMELNQGSLSNNLTSMNARDFVYREYLALTGGDQQPSNLFGNEFRKTPEVKPKQYYKIWLPPCFRWKFIKIRFDRLNLVTLLDPSLTKYELMSSIFLAVCVAILGSVIIEKGLFTDLWLFLFCFVICSSQYTLLKSVQPDAASPTHGYNRIIMFSRPTYFSIGCSIILLARLYTDSDYNWSFVLYDFNLLDKSVIRIVEESTKVFIMLFPIIFSFGLLPQINTFLMYLVEQIDIHMFGGTALTIGLTSAFYSLTRSLFFVGLLYSVALTSLYRVVSRNPVLPLTYHDYDVLFSVYCGLLVFFAFFLSRQSSDPTVVHNLLRKYVFCGRWRCQPEGENSLSSGVESNGGDSGDDKSKVEVKSSLEEDGEPVDEHYVDPLPGKLEKTVLSRLENDIILSIVITIVFFAIHVSKIFTLQPYVHMSLQIIAVTWGFLLHYIFPHFRKELPWLFFSSPIFKPREYDLYEVKGEANLMWYERFQCWLSSVEKNAIYPLVFLSALTKDTPDIVNRFGIYTGTLIVVICAFKSIRATFNDSSHNHMILLFTFLLFEYDLSYFREPFLINYAVFSTIYHKVVELLLKIRFVITYVAPWQISWGSAFHAFAQPFSVPHSGMLFVQAILSSILSSPLEPVLGSAIFLASYVRPIKFWERDYNTKRIDYSNTRLVNQLERSLIGSDDNNLNSIFYEHLTRSLQHSLCGDLVMGRWGQVSQGDCFVLASDNLNCLVHIIELGNGLVTFQVRGLEFRGTYCQQKEVEAINESVNGDEGCCCCEPGHLPSMLSVNAAFNQRWLAWEVTHSKYVLEGYLITDNSAASMLQPCELRKALITYYVKSIIYYTTNSPKLETWLKNEDIRETIDSLTRDKDFVDLDPIFMLAFDEDYDIRTSGITRASFIRVYFSWIMYCLSKRKNGQQIEIDQEKEAVLSLCFGLALLARRALSAASYNNCFNSVEFLLYGLHSLFKGDFRITSSRDEWVFRDIDLLKNVIAPSVRMAVKLHQDHFMSSDMYDDDAVLFAEITNYRKNWVISHEADPIWRNALLSNVPHLLALRHVYDDSSNQYKIIMLNIRHLSFRVIKVNRECVRGLWAGQQQELVYLRNNNAERGSIQNAKQALRNIINSSCDQPIGYPIYVSPLITSYAETNPQYSMVLGRSLSFRTFKRIILSTWNRLKTRCREGCSSGRAIQDDMASGEMLRSLNPIPATRISSLPCSFNRNQEARFTHESQCSDRSATTDFENRHLLARMSRNSACNHPPGTAYCHGGTKMVVNLSGKNATTTTAKKQSQFSTLVNVSAFRQQDESENIEMTTFAPRRSYDQAQTTHQSLTLSSTESASTSGQLYHRTRAESV
ncbi:pecanex [Brevipalpus obovatus]|uniref:pecanex n=1 Tax=Brevipalpus obovatus TaxID=246614 RepID=UPI003D9F816E